jgi:hypothetical protein
MPRLNCIAGFSPASVLAGLWERGPLARKHSENSPAGRVLRDEGGRNARRTVCFFIETVERYGDRTCCFATHPKR